MRPIMHFSDGGLRFTWVLAILSTAATVQQYANGNRSATVAGVALLALVCYVLLISYYRWTRWLRGNVERRKSAAKNK
jgi:membrane protein YdbS with pleckstrin-like domain